MKYKKVQILLSTVTILAFPIIVVIAAVVFITLADFLIAIAFGILVALISIPFAIIGVIKGMKDETAI